MLRYNFQIHYVPVIILTQIEFFILIHSQRSCKRKQKGHEISNMERKVADEFEDKVREGLISQFA